VALTYEDREISAMLAHVRSDVGKQGKHGKPASVLQDCGRFHTASYAKVEILEVIANSVDASLEC